jgi:hypothetical protein
MYEILRSNPWLILVGMTMLIPLFGVVFGTVTWHLTRVRRAELEAGLKQEMLQRGMSAEEISMVIEATSHRKRKSCGPESAVRDRGTSC